MKLKVRVIPRSSIKKIETLTDGTIKIKLLGAPVDGKVNEELIKFLSKEMKKKKSQIKIISGFTSREKILEIE